MTSQISIGDNRQLCVGFYVQNASFKPYSRLGRKYDLLITKR